QPGTARLRSSAPRGDGSFDSAAGGAAVVSARTWARAVGARSAAPSSRARPARWALAPQQEVQHPLQVILRVVRDLDPTAAVLLVADRHVGRELVAERLREARDLEVVAAGADGGGGILGRLLRRALLRLHPPPVLAAAPL